MTNPRGRFGIHGGQYIPETLMNAVIELEKAYDRRGGRGRDAVLAGACFCDQTGLAP